MLGATVGIDDGSDEGYAEGEKEGCEVTLNPSGTGAEVVGTAVGCPDG
jgi:hypothetical protein